MAGALAEYHYLDKKIEIQIKIMMVLKLQIVNTILEFKS